MEPCPGSRAEWMPSTRTRVNGNSALDMELLMAIPLSAVLFQGLLFETANSQPWRNTENCTG